VSRPSSALNAGRAFPGGPAPTGGSFAAPILGGGKPGRRPLPRYWPRATQVRRPR